MIENPLIRRTLTQINPLSYQCRGDGVADDTVGLQAALNAWIANPCAEMILPADKQFKITAPIVVNIAANVSTTRRIVGYGSRITPTAGVANVLTIKASGALARNVIIEGLTINGPATGYGLVLDGGQQGAEWLYGCVVRDCTIEGTVSGIYGYQNFFESSFENNHISLAGYTGYGFHFRNSAVAGNVSSITLLQNTTRNGKNGIRTESPVNDINIIGGTYLTAAEYGISLQQTLGGHITGAHVEACWSQAASAVEGQAGVRVIVTGNFSIRDLRLENSATAKMPNAVNAFIGTNSNLTIDGGYGTGLTNFSVLQGTDQTSSVSLIGRQSHSTVGSIAVTRNTGLRSRTPMASKIVKQITGATITVTPDIYQSVYHCVHTGNVTIANQTFTPTVGDELEFIFEQGVSGATTATWGTNYKFAPTALSPTFGRCVTVKFRWVLWTLGAGAWVCTGSYSN